MKKFLTFYLVAFATILSAQTPFQRVYNTLNTKCQNITCHNTLSVDASHNLLFDGTQTQVYNNIFNVDPTNTSSLSKHEKLVKQQHPYFSFLLRKIGSSFDTDLALDANEGSPMNDVAGQPLSNKEIEFIRQWIMFGAKQTYSGSDPQPNYQLVSDFYDELNTTGINHFLPKQPKPLPSEGIQLRMGPIFLPITGEIEQEYLEQQEVYFPYLPEVYKIEGIMNQQSHHFLLFKYQDTLAASNGNADDVTNMTKVQFPVTSFDGDKDLTSSWQNDADLVLPTGTALFWDQKTILDMNYHIKNFNATFVLPCDFYFNIYFKPRSVSTIEMKSQLSQNFGIFLPANTNNILLSRDDNANSGSKETRYLWMMAGHTHQWGTNFNMYQRDTLGHLNNLKVYDGAGLESNWGSYYDNSLGYWDWHHPPIEYWPNLLPIQFGKHGGVNAGLVSKALYNNTTNNFLTFSTQTTGEMQLWYYMYTTQPLSSTTTAVDDTPHSITDLNIYPNPNNGQFKLQYTNLYNSKYDLRIVDMIGNTVYSDCREINSGSYNESINIRGISTGEYLLSLSDGHRVYSKQFIVK